MTHDEIYVLAGWVAGYRWRAPAQDRTGNLPDTVVTVSDCLTEFLPHDYDALTAPWHASLEDAINAAKQAPPGTRTVHLLAMSVPTTGVARLANMMDQWIGDYLHPIRLNLARHAPPPVGEVRGFEVLGFEAGRLHSWLCYGLLAEATETLGIHVNGLGLLATLIGAQEVADMANSNRGTPDGTPADVTWFPALLTEHGTEQHGRVRSSSPIGHGSRP